MKKILKTRRKLSIISLVTIMVIVAEVLIVNRSSKTYAATLPEKFDLRSQIEIVVKNQYGNEVCPYMSRATLLETHVKLGQKNGKYGFFKETPVFSVMTSKYAGDFVPVSIDKTEKAIQELYGDTLKSEDDVLKVDGEYGNKQLTDKLEKLEQSFDVVYNGKVDKSNKIKYKSLPIILKEYTDSGIIYKDSKDNELSQDQVKEIRSGYKEFLMQNGGLVCGIQTSGFRDGVNGEKVNLNKKITTATGNHSVLIIGWDDTYSKENFPEDNRPSTDGAYLVQNSWGSEWGDKGAFYVSYEDIYIETDIQGIEGITEYKDTTVPTISAVENDNNKLTISVSDKYSSGVDESSIKYMFSDHNVEPELTDQRWISIKNDVEVDNQPNKYLWVYAKDKEGNESFYSSGLNLKGLMIEGANWNCDTWSNKDVVVQISDANTLIGEHNSFELVISSNTLSSEELKQMEQVEESLDHKLTINKDGKHTIYISKIENGEEFLGQKIIVWIDKTNPTDAEINVSGDKDGEKYYSGATVEIKGGEDTVSGVKEVNIEIKDKNGQDIDVQDKNKFVLENEGTYTVKVTTVDNATNKSEVTKTIDVVDRQNDDEQDDGNKQDDNKQDDDKKDDGKQDDDKQDDDKKDDGKQDDNKQDDDKKDDGKQDDNKQDDDKKDDGKQDDDKQDDNKQDNNKQNQNYENTKVESNDNQLEVDTKGNESKKDNNQSNKQDSNKNQNNKDSNNKTSSISSEETEKSNQTEQKPSQIENLANKILPATGSNTEIKIIVAIGVAIFLGVAIHTYRNVKKNG